MYNQKALHINRILYKFTFKTYSFHWQESFSALLPSFS